MSALDYIVKPVNYYDFALKLTRALKRVDSVRTNVLSISTQAGTTRVDLDDITYVEVQNHQLTYHTVEGTYSQYGSISALAKELADKGFAQCNSCYLVNLQHVREVTGYTLCLSDRSELKISQPRKRAFTEVYRAYRAGRELEA